MAPGAASEHGYPTSDALNFFEVARRGVTHDDQINTELAVNAKCRLVRGDRSANGQMYVSFVRKYSILTNAGCVISTLRGERPATVRISLAGGAKAYWFFGIFLLS